MKTMILILLISILSATAFAQRAIEPTRVALTFEDSDTGREFDKRLHAELNKLRRIAFTSERVDFDVFATSGPIITGEKTVGYAVAIAVVRGDGRISVLLVMERTIEATARRTARRLNEEFFDRR